MSPVVQVQNLVNELQDAGLTKVTILALVDNVLNTSNKELIKGIAKAHAKDLKAKLGNFPTQEEVCNYFIDFLWAPDVKHFGGWGQLLEYAKEVKGWQPPKADASDA